MQVCFSAQVSENVYNKHLANIGPATTNTEFMARVMSMEKRRAMTQQKKVPTNETLWKTAANPEKGTKYKTQRNPARDAPSAGPEGACFNCGEDGHYRRDCPKCTYCKKGGHRVRNCRKRIDDAKGKYCKHCKIKDSHNTSECRKHPQKVNKLSAPSKDEDPEGHAWAEDKSSDDGSQEEESATEL